MKRDLKDKTNPYEDMLYLPHHTSPNRRPLSMAQRAAQFSPFQALTGYEAAVEETARVTEEKVVLSEEEKELLDYRLAYVRQHLSERPWVRVTYFVPDERKEGGAYAEVTGRVERIDTYRQELRLTDGGTIPFDAICGFTLDDIQE